MDIQQILSEIKSSVHTLTEEMQTKHHNLQIQVDAIDLNTRQKYVPPSTGGHDGLKAFCDALIEHRDGLQRHGRVSFEVPSLLPEGKSILSTDLFTAQPATGIAGEGKFPYRLRKLFRTVPVETGSVFVLRSTSEQISPAPQVEGQDKAESTATFQGAVIPVQTIAHFVTVSKQALDDVPGLSEFLRSVLIWGLEREAEAQILAGDGTGVNLSGIIPVATPFDSTILTPSAGWNYIDQLLAAQTQVREAGYSPNFACVNPRDQFALATLKDTTGAYILERPLSGLEIVQSDQISRGTFLVGDSSQAVIRQRQVTTIDISHETGENFKRNLATIRAEERFALQMQRREGFVTGSFVSSPA